MTPLGETSSIKRLNLVRSVFGPLIDGDHTRQTVLAPHVVDVTIEIGDARLQRREILVPEIRDLDAPVKLQRADRGDNHPGRRLQTRLAALDIDKLLSAQVRTETRLCDHIVGELQCGPRGHHRVAAVRNVGERPAVNERRIVLQRLHQVWRQRILQQHGHCTVRLQVARQDGLLRRGITDDDPAQAILQIGEAARQAEDRHDLGSHHDVETILARISRCPDRPTRPPSQRSARSLVSNTRRMATRRTIESQLVAVIDVIVDQRREQIVGLRDRIEVAGEMEVDVLHRDHLRVAAARGASLDAEHRAQRRLAQTDERLLADEIERIAQAYSRSGLALAGGRWRDRGDQDQLAIGPPGQLANIIERYLGLEAPVRLQALLGNSQTGRWASGRIGRRVACCAISMFRSAISSPSLDPKRVP